MLVQTIARLLGPGLVSAQRIENLDKHRFASTSLLGKLPLVDDDVRAGIRLPDGELKKISEAKPITAEPCSYVLAPSWLLHVSTFDLFLCFQLLLSQQNNVVLSFLVCQLLNKFLWPVCQ